MRLWTAIAAATAAELCFAGAVLGLLSLLGRWNGWLDLLAQFAPFWLAIALLGAFLAWFAIEPGWDRRAVLILAAVGIGALSALIAPEFLRNTEFAPAGDRGVSLRVLTFNTWDDNISPDRTVDVILNAKADVVALQEIGGLGSSQRLRLLAAYPYWISCRPRGCDVALLSKSPWAASEFRLPDAESGLTAVWGKTSAPDGAPLEVLTTHYLWPVPPAPQAAQRRALAALAGTLDKSDLILTGDFNLAPWSAALVGQDKALSPLIRRTRAVFTWPANIARVDRPSPIPLLPIDHIYAGPDWSTLKVQRLPRTGSDHFGVLAVLVRAVIK